LFNFKNYNKSTSLFLISLFLIVIVSVFLFKPPNDKNEKIRVKLITSVHKDLPFEFVAEEKNILIIPGEVKTINYSIKNLTDKNFTGVATFQVYPSELKDYMTKMNCFCYEEQTLKGGEKQKYALVLLVDPNVTKNIKEAIIQFIFFKK
tara:strand:+ start:3927 stop:4373 length:447 start_codon:yes stop_codon:yes gene_type:complete